MEQSFAAHMPLLTATSV